MRQKPVNTQQHFSRADSISIKSNEVNHLCFIQQCEQNEDWKECNSALTLLAIGVSKLNRRWRHVEFRWWIDISFRFVLEFETSPFNLVESTFSDQLLFKIYLFSSTASDQCVFARKCIEFGFCGRQRNKNLIFDSNKTLLCTPQSAFYLVNS